MSDDKESRQEQQPELQPEAPQQPEAQAQQPAEEQTAQAGTGDAAYDDSIPEGTGDDDELEIEEAAPAESDEAAGQQPPEAPGAQEAAVPDDSQSAAEPTEQWPVVQVLHDQDDLTLPAPGAPGSQPAPFDPQQSARWQELLGELEQEISAVGEVPAAAPLYYEAGRIWEEKLSQPRNAWTCYNKAYQLQPKLVPNIRAAARLAAQVGNWNVAVQIIESEIDAVDDAQRRAHLYHRRGLILEEKLGQVEEARKSYRQASELVPGNLEFLKSLERLAVATGDWEDVIRVREQMIAATSDNNVKVQLLLGCAQIQQAVLGDGRQGEQYYQRALQISPDCAEALAELREYYAAQREHEKLLDILQREAAVTTEPASTAWLLYQAARLLREKLGEDERALQVLGRILALVPGHRMALAEMASILENLMRWQELVECYQKMVKTTSDKQQQVSLYFKLGNIWEEKLFNEDQALESYRRVVELNPRYLPALQTLGKLFYRKGQWSQLVDMYEMEIRETGDNRQKAVRLYKLAEILEERLGRDEEAIQKLEQSLEFNPGFLPVLKSLGRLYTKYNRWESLIGMYEKELEVTRDHDQSVFLLDKIGTLWDEKLNNIDKAIETYRRLLEISPNYLPAIRILGKLYVQADRWEEMIEINRIEAQMVNDQKQVVSLLHRNGEIYEEKLNDKDKAIETYQQVLALSPAYLPALQSLGRLYFVKGRWEDLIDMHRQEIEVTVNEDQQIALLYKIGQLYEEKLLQEDKAVSVYQEVLRIQPANVPALKALIRIYTNKRDWRQLIDVYEREAEILEDVQQKALSLFRVAEICQQHLEDSERAVATLQKVLQVVPDHGPAIRSLVRLFTRSQDWRGLLTVYEQQLRGVSSERQQVLILTRMAEVLALRLGDLAGAAEKYEQILTLRPDWLPALESLERILLSQRHFPALVRVYTALAGRTSDQQLQLALHEQLADLKENRLQPPQDSGDDLVAVLRVNPAHPEARRSLEMQYVKFGTWRGLLLLYEAALRQGAPLEETLDLCLRAADLAATRLDDQDSAIHYYQEALRLKPGYLPAVKMLRRLRQQRGENREVLRLLELEERSLRDERQIMQVIMTRARMLLEMNEHQAASDCLLRALEREPHNEQAFSQLRELLQQQADWDRLALVLRNRLEVTEDAQERAALQVELGYVTWHRLSRPQEAIRNFQKALEIQPSNDQAVEALAELTFDAEQWEQAVEYGTRLQELTTEPARLVPVHLRLGVIYHDKLPDRELAIQHLRRVLALQPGHLEVLQRLQTIYQAGQQWSEAAEVMEQLAVAEQDPARRVQVLLEQAQIQEQGLEQPDRAIDTLRRVAELEPTNLEVIQKLADLYERLERWEELVEAIQSFIRLLPPERQQDAIPLHLKMAELYRRKLNNTEKAIIEYKHICELNPRHLGAHEALAELYGSSGLYYANAIDEHRTLLQINPFRIDSYHELRRIFEQQRVFDKVLCVCAVLHYLRAADQNEEFFYGENRAKVPDRSTEKLGETELETQLLHPREHGLVRRLLKLAGSYLTKIYPARLERHGVGKADRARPDDPLRSLVGGMIANLGAFEVDIYHSSQPSHLVAVENCSPPALVVPEGLTKRSVVKEQRFALGRALKLIHDGSFLGVLLGAKELARLVAALVHPYQPQSPVVTFPGQLPADFIKRIHKSLPRKVRKALEELLANQGGELARVPDYDSYLQAVICSADRFGLLMCNDIAQAMLHRSREKPELRDKRFSSTSELAEALIQHADLCELLRFAVSEEYFRLRARMKFSLV